jgi:Phage terminase large subunit gpA, ATPase domain
MRSPSWPTTWPTMPTLADVRRQALASLRPPPRLRLSEWIEHHLQLPEGVSALPGPVRLWPYQRAIADAIGDPAIERVTLVKPVRVGFTTLLTGAIAAFMANDPCPVLVLQPTESDVRDYVVSDLEPVCQASPAVAGLLTTDSDEAARNTLASRRFPGGSLLWRQRPRGICAGTPPACCSSMRRTRWTPARREVRFCSRSGARSAFRTASWCWAPPRSTRTRRTCCGHTRRATSGSLRCRVLSARPTPRFSGSTSSGSRVNRRRPHFVVPRAGRSSLSPQNRA